jgi:hypothetical protein
MKNYEKAVKFKINEVYIPLNIYESIGKSIFVTVGYENGKDLIDRNATIIISTKNKDITLIRLNEIKSKILKQIEKTWNIKTE